MTTRATRALLLVLAGIGLGFWICFFHPMPRVDAQGVGIFTTAATGTRINCAQVTGGVEGQTWCFDQATHQISVWTGASFTTVSVNNALPYRYTLGGQSNRINDYLQYIATGTEQQVGLFVDMVASNTLSSAGDFRVPLGVRMQVGNAATADGGVALNVIAQQNAGAIGFLNGVEVSFNNNLRNDPLNPVDKNHFGMTLDAYGGFSTGPAALAIRSGQANSTWQRGVWIPASTINTNGYAFDYEGDGTGNAVRISRAGLLTIGGSSGSGLQFANGSTLQDDGVNTLTIKGGSAGVRILNSAGSIVNMTLGDTGAATLVRSLQIGTPSAGDPGTGWLRVASGVFLNSTQTLWNGVSATNAPQCTNNCGTSPTVAGNNTAMRVTMGATGTPRSPFLVLFNGAWNATPSCIAQLTTATTTTVSVTNATTTGVTVNTVIGPAQGDVYAIHCLGVG